VNNNKESKKENSMRLKSALDLYDNAPCGSVSFQNDGLILDLNKTLAVWLGYSKEELIKKRTLPSLFKIGGQIFFETHFFPLIKMQGFIKEVYFDIVKKDKSTLHGLINVREIPHSDNQNISYQATILDISDRWHYESELLKSKQLAEAESKAKADFLATISHEIRTPLNSILGIGNLLHQTPLNKNQKEYARLLLHSSEHLLSLVNNLLDLSKIEAKKIVLEHVPFNIVELTNILQQTFSVRANEKGIKLSVEIQENTSHSLIGDSVKLNQILTNLIGNAIKFTKKGMVSLSISVEKNTKSEVCLHFKVKDTGIGIPKEKLESIFQEFSQASYDVSVEFGGTGLGLTISKKLLEMHQSNLNVTSELNVGSEFSFNIWYTKSQTSIPKKETIGVDILKNHNFNSLKVLVVDDNPANIFIAAQYLDLWKITYKTANSGLKAINLTKKYDFDIILLDLQMPKMNGYDVAKKIRKLKLNLQPVIIAFSASAKSEVSNELLEAGINDHLPKPFQPIQLFELLRDCQNPIKKKNSLYSKSIKKPKNNTITSIKTNVESFNLERFQKMANNKPEYLKKFRLSTLDALISYQKDFKKAIKTKDINALSGLIHKSTMSLYYIQADPLSDLLNECRRILTEEPENKSLIIKNKKKIKDEFTIIINGLKKE
jgi:PAS domain S-box-containing protein